MLEIKSRKEWFDRGRRRIDGEIEQCFKVWSQ